MTSESDEGSESIDRKQFVKAVAAIPIMTHNTQTRKALTSNHGD